MENKCRFFFLSFPLRELKAPSRWYNWFQGRWMMQGETKKYQKEPDDTCRRKERNINAIWQAKCGTVRLSIITMTKRKEQSVYSLHGGWRGLRTEQQETRKWHTEVVCMRAPRKIHCALVLASGCVRERLYVSSLSLSVSLCHVYVCNHTSCRA